MAYEFEITYSHDFHGERYEGINIQSYFADEKTAARHMRKLMKIIERESEEFGGLVFHTAEIRPMEAWEYYA